MVQVTVPAGFNIGRVLPAQGSERQEAGAHDQDGRTDINAATAPGKVCELRGSVIGADQEARRRVNGEWIHEACPIH